ncbi:hypothetical protein BpHYR1_046736 [Brachionus plicatilis]|uniref:Uncharacterized protein n=1 Tax=Brachionus plicatilis TaxID=10195 RepID=A0A3M7SEN6_BRAPC|nr:hypothetical protein BpHYR1_046736 [Brachionus plicatilis]
MSKFCIIISIEHWEILLKSINLPFNAASTSGDSNELNQSRIQLLSWHLHPLRQKILPCLYFSLHLCDKGATELLPYFSKLPSKDSLIRSLNLCLPAWNGRFQVIVFNIFDDLHPKNIIKISSLPSKKRIYNLKKSNKGIIQFIKNAIMDNNNNELQLKNYKLKLAS